MVIEMDALPDLRGHGPAIEEAAMKDEAMNTVPGQGIDNTIMAEESAMPVQSVDAENA